HARFVCRVSAFADVLLVNRLIGAVILRHLVALRHGSVAGVRDRLHVLLVDRLADRELAGDVVVFPLRPIARVAAGAHMLLVDRLAGRVAAFFHHRVVDGAVTGAGLLFDHGAVTYAVADGRHAALLGRAALRRVRARPAV